MFLTITVQGGFRERATEKEGGRDLKKEVLNKKLNGRQLYTETHRNKFSKFII